MGESVFVPEVNLACDKIVVGALKPGETKTFVIRRSGRGRPRQPQHPKAGKRMKNANAHAKQRCKNLRILRCDGLQCRESVGSVLQLAHDAPERLELALPTDAQIGLNQCQIRKAVACVQGVDSV